MATTKETGIQLTCALCTHGELLGSPCVCQFLARLGSRPSLCGIQPAVFGDQGPQTKDVIELYGDEGTGKTEMLVHLICRCILPEYWNKIPLNGHGAGVIFIDTDFKFSIIHLVNVIEKYIYERAKNFSDDALVNLENIESFIRDCLMKLHIIRCSNSDQLIASLNNLENLICQETSVSVIMIDSISAFYWIDKCFSGDSVQAQETGMRYVTEIFTKLVNTYSLILFATKSVVYKKKGLGDNFEGEGNFHSDSKQQKQLINEDLESLHAEFMCKPWQRFVSHRLVLVKELQDGNQQHSFIIGGDCVQGNKRFLVTEARIHFLK